MTTNEQPKSLVPLTEEDKFKRILEYFVKHMVCICKKKKDAYIDELTQNFDGLEIADGCISGQGYKNARIQGFMEKNAGVENNNCFSCKSDKDQLICISIDSSIGYKGGSYLHLVTRTMWDKQDFTESMGTDINPLFREKAVEQKTKYEFWGLEIAPEEKLSPLFPTMPFSFDDLGLGEPNPTAKQKSNLRMFFEYFIEMRKQELEGTIAEMGTLTYKGKEQLLATHNLILTGAPGTGKTWSAKNIASWIICQKPYEKLTADEKKGAFADRCKVVQFHPSYDYTDFVEGLRPTSENQTENKTDDKTKNTGSTPQATQVGFKRVDGVFKKFCEEAVKEWDKCHQNVEDLLQVKCINKERTGMFLNALQRKDDELCLNEGFNPETFSCPEDSEGLNNCKKVVEKATKKFAKKYVFIIDEINRGELSKIFGELFYSIDPGYRGEDGRVDTQYQNMITDENDKFKGGFYVPENVYVIGTMNDIDRSVESMDFAMRRRFSFIEVKANERMDMWTEDWKDLAKACMEAINEKIESLPGLSSAYHIGPAYFKKLNNYMEQQGDDYPDFFKLWDNHLYGVIFEYLRGKKDAEKTMIEIQEDYLKALVEAVKARFNNNEKWGRKLKVLLKDDTKDFSLFEIIEEYRQYKKDFNNELNDTASEDVAINNLSQGLFKEKFDNLLQSLEDLEKKGKKIIPSSFKKLKKLKEYIDNAEYDPQKLDTKLLNLLVTRIKEIISVYLYTINDFCNSSESRRREEILKLDYRIQYVMNICKSIDENIEDGVADNNDEIDDDEV